MSTITLKTENVYAVLINVYVPNKEKYEEEKDLFYATVEDVFNASLW